MKSIMSKRTKKKAFIEKRRKIKKTKREKLYRSYLNLKIKVFLSLTTTIKKRIIDHIVSIIKELATTKLYTKSYILN